MLLGLALMEAVGEGGGGGGVCGGGGCFLAHPATTNITANKHKAGKWDLRECRFTKVLQSNSDLILQVFFGSCRL
jgi:hypothetical protein